MRRKTNGVKGMDGGDNDGEEKEERGREMLRNKNKNGIRKTKNEP